MALKKLKTEKYMQLVTSPALGIDFIEKIICPLQEYAIFKDVESSSSSMSVTEGKIPSIQAYLKIHRLYTQENRDLSVSAEFSYVEGTSEEDLNQVRDVIKNAGLEPLVE